MCRDFHGPHHCSECLPSTLLKTSCWDRKILLSLFCRWSAEIFGDLPTAEFEIRGRVKNKTCSPCSLPLLTHNTAFFFFFLHQLWASVACLEDYVDFSTSVDLKFCCCLFLYITFRLCLKIKKKKNSRTSKLLTLLISYLIKRGGRTITDLPSYL